MDRRHTAKNITGRNARVSTSGPVRPRAVRPRNNGRSSAILEAAQRLFSEQGYTAVSIKKIAKTARVNSGLLYYYFANKEHLLVEALKYSARIATLDDQRSKQRDPIADINFWFDANLKMAMPLGQMLRLMLEYRTTRKRSLPVERLIRDFYDAEMEVLRNAIERGIRTGLFRRVDTTKTSLFVSTHLDGLMVAASVRPGYDLRAGFLQMRKILLAWLGCDQLSRLKSGARSKLRVVA
jgi:TetR/AcrR family transcriptional regulator